MAGSHALFSLYHKLHLDLALPGCTSPPILSFSTVGALHHLSLDPSACEIWASGCCTDGKKSLRGFVLPYWSFLRCLNLSLFHFSQAFLVLGCQSLRIIAEVNWRSFSIPTEISPDPELLRQHSDSIVLWVLQTSTLTPLIAIQHPVLTGSEFAVPPLSKHCQVHLARLNLFFSRFPITDGDKPERMVAEALTALSATALCAVLQEWQGPQHVNNDFNANLFAETYAHHIGFLQDLKAKSIKAYEKSLVRLYREAS
ncbi:hypothetical protein B0H10DRAFT_1963908 [Mycena sp. CBHHK59/15]|nr:hypothetical protein B0H10DRAFT_1963908 [Mycena sp. CBHHK59/15]